MCHRGTCAQQQHRGTYHITLQEKQIRKLILKNKDNIYLKEFYYSYGRIPNCNFVVYKTSYVRLTQNCGIEVENTRKATSDTCIHTNTQIFLVESTNGLVRLLLHRTKLQ